MKGRRLDDPSIVAIAPAPSFDPARNGDHPAHGRSHRASRLRLSVAASVASKGASVVQQTLAVPLVARSLGPSGFGQLALVTSAFGWVGLAGLGIGPRLTQGIAESVSRGDKARESQLFGTAMAVSFLSVALLAVVLALGATVATALGTRIEGVTGDVAVALILAAAFSIATASVSGFDAALLGYQAQFITGAMSSASFIASTVLLIFAAIASPTVSSMVVALMVPAFCARLASGVVLVRMRPYLLRGRPLVDRRLIRPLVIDGLWFSMISLATFATQQFTLLVLGASLGPAGIAGAAVMLRLSNLLGSIVVMITTPAWPALVEATSHRDLAWVNRAYLRLMLAAVMFATAAGLIVALGGPGLVGSWTGHGIPVTSALTTLFLPYFALGVWSHVHSMVAVGIGELRLAAITLGLEALTAVALVAAAPRAPVVMLLAPTTAAAAWSVWLLPLVVRRRLRRLAEGAS